MMTLRVSSETWSKCVDQLVLGHVKEHRAVSERSLRAALAELRIEVKVVRECAQCGHDLNEGHIVNAKGGSRPTWDGSFKCTHPGCDCVVAREDMPQ